MIRVIIEREIAEGLEAYYESAVFNLLGVLSNAPGYLSGDSLVDVHRPNHYMVVTRWTNEDAWNRWAVSGERQQLLDAIRPFLLNNEEKITMMRQLELKKDVLAD